MIDMTRPMPTLMLGGPADAKRIALEPGTREYYCPVLPDLLLSQGGQVETVTYVVGTLRGTFNEIFYVGLRNLNDDPISMLIQGYKRPESNLSDAAEAEHLVTLLGGYHDGRRMAVADLQTVIEAPEGNYAVVPLVGKDHKHYRVALRDPLAQCPIRMLVEGYRVKVPA